MPAKKTLALLVSGGASRTLKSLAAAMLGAHLVLFTAAVSAGNTPACGGEENSEITATTKHLTDNADGTISDPETGLVWKRCSEGQSWDVGTNGCSGTADSMNWQAALQRAQTVNAGNGGQNLSQTDWRLPNIKELSAIVELRCSGPAINDAVFPDTPSLLFWSSSSYAIDNSSAWYVFFNNGGGEAGFKSENSRVRLVRSGQ